MIQPIRILDDPILRSRASSILELNSETAQIILDLSDTFRANKGAIGLAAPQIGVSKRIIVFMDELTKGLRVVINPQIVSRGKEIIIELERCLSLPNTVWPVGRSKWVILEGMDEWGIHFRGFFGDPSTSRVIQHEIDHLFGILITDYKA
jgi:peptide deformylase